MKIWVYRKFKEKDGGQSGQRHGGDDWLTYSIEVECIAADDSIHISIANREPTQRVYHREAEAERGQLELPSAVAAKMALMILAQATGLPGEPICFEYDEQAAAPE